MSSRITIDGIKTRIIDPNLGQGGQGVARKVVLESNHKVELVVKSQPANSVNLKRSEILARHQLPALSPYLAGPIAMTQKGGEILHLAPFAGGQDIGSDKPRTFPRLLEICHLISCQLVCLEEEGLAHGDIAPSNVIISDDGRPSLIDFDNFVSLDRSVPKATMAGQAMMMAPEIRLHKQPPTIESDRYAYGVLFSMILLRRHPADGLANTPTELSTVMTQGQWPERIRPLQKGETPIAVLGPDLLTLFDQAFSLSPKQRPSADTWRRAFFAALQSIYIHTCGEGFIKAPHATQCPHCHAVLAPANSPKAHVFKVTIPSLGRKYSFSLKDGDSVYLGRNNLGREVQSVSNRHISVTRFKNKLHLHHLGQNPSAIYKDGLWYRLESLWLEPRDYAPNGVNLRLADLDIRLDLS